MLTKIKFIFSWMYLHVKQILFIAASIFFGVFVYSFLKKNQKIKQLQAELDVARYTIEMDKLSVKYNSERKDLIKLGEQEQAIRAELVRIESEMGKKLEPNMTAEEIAQKFREVGIRS